MMTENALETRTGPVRYQAVPRSSVVEAVREHLTALVAERALRPGDALPPERELMQVLGVGRSSLREALAALVAVGILTTGRSQGYRVRSLTPPEQSLPAGLRGAQIQELFEARGVLELGIAELACARATEDDFARMEECLTSIRRAFQARRSTAPAAGRFHLLLARAAHNGLLEAQLQGIQSLMVQVGVQTEHHTGSHFGQEQWEAHHALLTVLRTRDAAAMRAAMEDHLRRFESEAAG